MATPKEIPSKVNTAGSTVTASPGNALFITALLVSDTLTVTIGGTSTDCGSPGPVALPSPIQCSSFSPNVAGQVAYYEL